MSASETLAAWLERTGMPKMKLAAELEVTPSLITHYTSGRRKPSRVLAIAIEKISNGEVPASLWHEPKPPLPKGSQALLDWMVDMRTNRSRAATHFGVCVAIFTEALNGHRISPKLLNNLKDWGPQEFDRMGEQDFRHAG